MCLHAAIVCDLNNVEFSACVFFVSSLVNLVTDERKKEKAKARATAGKCHGHYCSSVNMIITDVSVMGLHHR